MVESDVNEDLAIVKNRLAQLKNEEKSLTDQREQLIREINLHVKECCRLRDEEMSTYRRFPVFKDGRYLFLSLLGKGGFRLVQFILSISVFSEVWKAYDFQTRTYVACKLHKVNPDWPDGQKANYVKRAMREKEIQKSLIHQHIVRSIDVFVLDNNCFCSVLEYCGGNDLDFYLKQYKYLPEKDAKVVILQVRNEEMFACQSFSRNVLNFVAEKVVLVVENA